MKTQHRRGFTLIELAIVIVIAGILAAVAIPIYQSFVDDAKWSEAEATIGAIKTAVQVYGTRYGLAELPAVGYGGTTTAWEAIGFGDWDLQYWAVGSFKVTAGATYVISVDTAQGPPPNPPKDAGTISIDANGVWTRTGSAK